MRKQIESISRYIFPLYDEKTSIWRYGSEHQCVAAPFSLLSPSQLPHSGCVGQWPWALACTGYICSKRGTKRRGRSSTVPKHFGVSASSQDRHPVRRRRPLSVCLLFSGHLVPSSSSWHCCLPKASSSALLPPGMELGLGKRRLSAAFHRTACGHARCAMPMNGQGTRGPSARDDRAKQA